MCSIACKLASFAPCFSLSFISETIVAQTPLSLKLCLITLKKGKATTNISPVSKKEHILPRSFLQNPNTNPKQTIDETAENAGGHFHTGRRREHSKVQDVPTLIPKHRAYKSPFWTGKVTCVCEIELGNRQGNFGSKRQLGQIKPRLDFVLFFVSQNQPNFTIPETTFCPLGRAVCGALQLIQFSVKSPILPQSICQNHVAGYLIFLFPFTTFFYSKCCPHGPNLNFHFALTSARPSLGQFTFKISKFLVNFIAFK